MSSVIVLFKIYTTILLWGTYLNKLNYNISDTNTVVTVLNLQDFTKVAISVIKLKLLK